MSGPIRILVLLALLSFPLSASAFGHRPRAVPTASYYYYPAPWVVVPEVVPFYVPVAPAPACVPAVPAPNYAIPTPAPATNRPPPMAPTTPPPPASAPKPAVSETPTPSTSYYAGPAGSSCTVAFWNHSDRDVTLTIDGQRRLLPRGKGVTLDLSRTFTWQTDSKAPQQEQVPAENPGMEIVIRR